MDTALTYGFGAVLVMVAAYLARETWIYYGQYRTISGVDLSESPTLASGETVTIHGLARVREPVSGTGHAGDLEGDAKTGLLAWRLRRRKRKRRRGSSRRRYRWSTEEAGLEVGRLAVHSPEGAVEIDADAACNLLPDGWGPDDPWEANGLHLGEADEETDVDDPRDFGPALPIDVDVGPLSTGERSRLEVNRIADGDEVVVHGRLVRTDDGLAITSGEGADLVLGSGSIDEVIGDLRAKIAKHALFVAVLLVVAAAIFGGYADGLEVTF